jgi:hypothetical protein
MGVLFDLETLWKTGQWPDDRAPGWALEHASTLNANLEAPLVDVVGDTLLGDYQSTAVCVQFAGLLDHIRSLEDAARTVALALDRLTSVRERTPIEHEACAICLGAKVCH